MGWIGIHNFYHIAYRLALALYKIQFEEIWHHKITNIISLLSNKRIGIVIHAHAGD